MKKFLVLTDFSQNAQHASEYAMRLALKRKAAIQLVHVFEDPVPISESEPTMLHFHNMEQRILEQLEDLRQELIQKYGTQVPITCAVYDRFLIERIQGLFEQPEVRLAIIGLTGSGMSRYFLGSNTLNIVQESGCTILTVPPNVAFRPIKNIVFAYNADDIPPAAIPIRKIRKILSIFEAKLHVLQVRPTPTPPEMIATNEIILADLFKGVSFDLYSVKKKNIMAGIKDFAKEQKADLIAIVPKKRDFWGDLLHTNHTKTMLFRSDVPVLSIPGESS